jgi:hypothetical protein
MLAGAKTATVMDKTRAANPIVMPTAIRALQAPYATQIPALVSIADDASICAARRRRRSIVVVLAKVNS